MVARYSMKLRQRLVSTTAGFDSSACAIRDLSDDNIISIDFSRDSSGWDLTNAVVAGNSKFDAVKLNA